MNEANKAQLQESARILIDVVGNDVEKAKIAGQFLDRLIAQFHQLAVSQNSDVNNHTQVQSGFRVTPERLRIAHRLAGFSPKGSFVMNEITTRFGKNVKHPELVNVAQLLASQASIKLDRDAKRRKNVLYKWFEENWEKIAPFIDNVVLQEVQDPTKDEE